MPPLLRAQILLRSVDTPEKNETRNIWAPFAFYSESMEAGFGIGGATSGAFGQEQAFTGGAAFISTNGSEGLYFIAEDIALAPRFFTDVHFFFTRLAHTEEFVDGNPNFPGRAGSNDSSKDDFVISESADIDTDITLRYVLPIGHARDSAIAHYTLNHGMLVEGASGATSWNPV